MKTYLYRGSNLKSYRHFRDLSFMAEVNFWRLPKTIVSCDLFIITRECGSTLYVLYEDLLYRASSLKSTITFLALIS